MAKARVFNQEAQEQRILELADAIEEELGIKSWFQVSHKFSLEIPEERVSAETTADWEYRQATMKWYLAITSSREGDELEATVLHEYIHVLLAPIHKYMQSGKVMDDLNEYTCETITQVLLNVRRFNGV